MSIALKYLPEYNYKDYLRWEGHWELIEGLAYAMNPRPNIKHQKISGKLYRAIDDEIEI